MQEPGHSIHERWPTHFNQIPNFMIHVVVKGGRGGGVSNTEYLSTLYPQIYTQTSCTDIYLLVPYDCMGLNRECQKV